MCISFLAFHGPSLNYLVHLSTLILFIIHVFLYVQNNLCPVLLCITPLQLIVIDITLKSCQSRTDYHYLQLTATEKH